jgi:hypothetical protein
MINILLVLSTRQTIQTGETILLSLIHQNESVYTSNYTGLSVSEMKIPKSQLKDKLL